MELSYTPIQLATYNNLSLNVFPSRMFSQVEDKRMTAVYTLYMHMNFMQK